MALATILHGWAVAEQGHGEEGIPQLRQGLAAWQATGAEHERPYWLALLAEGCGQEGQIEKGLAALAEALKMVQATGDCEYAAELYRLKGELVLQAAAHRPRSETLHPQRPAPSTHAEAEAAACFQRAIAIARQQQAKSWELRAVMSLARLWQQQGKREEARQMLAEICHWFTEGFETKDLQDAKGLLAVWSQ